MVTFSANSVFGCLALIFFFMACGAASGADPLDAASWPGLIPTAEMRELAPLVNEMETAMKAKDRAGVMDAVAKLQDAHGKFAGVPEVRPEYVSPVNAEEPDLERVIQLWRNSFERMKGRNAWERAPALDAAQQTGDRLRVSLRHARAYLQSFEAGLDTPEEYRAYALKGFDYIVSCQGGNGCFGYPYHPGGPGLKAGAAEMVDRIVASGIPMERVVERGWIIDDFDQSGGGLQFDNGMCGIGLLHAYAHTGESKYLEAARRAAEWAAEQRIARNWNYNCFSGQLLARLYRVTGETRYLDEARTKFEVGVLPGQMENGRWFDQHNARIQYHSVMLRSLIDYYLALEQAGDADNATRVSNHILRGLDNLAAQITTHGASNAHELLSLDALSLGLLIFGDKTEWVRAANVNVNALCDAMLPQLEAHGMPMTETVASYILYRKSKEGAAESAEVMTGMRKIEEE